MGQTPDGERAHAQRPHHARVDRSPRACWSRSSSAWAWRPHSLGLISAGIESSGDVIAATLTFFAVRLGGRPADRGHPYGHRRAENLGALGEAAILLVGGLLVCVDAISRLASSARRPRTSTGTSSR